MQKLLEQFTRERLEAMVSDETFPVATVGEVKNLAQIALAVMDGKHISAYPTGWKIVPEVPFPSQWAAGKKAMESAGINKIDAVYSAMVKASPGVSK